MVSEGVQRRIAGVVWPTGSFEYIGHRAVRATATGAAGRGMMDGGGGPGAACRRDGCSQTDRKDLSKALQPSAPPARALDSPSGTKHYHHHHHHHHSGGSSAPSAKVPNFEREIQKLLEDQNLLKNIPPKSDRTHQNKEIISLEELKNVNQVLAELGQCSYLDRQYVGRYVEDQASLALSNANNNSSTGSHASRHVGLAAIQELVRTQLDNSAVQVGACKQPLQCFIDATAPVLWYERGSSKEGSLKRAREPSPPAPPEDSAKEEFLVTLLQRKSSPTGLSNSKFPLRSSQPPADSCQGVQPAPSARSMEKESNKFDDLESNLDNEAEEKKDNSDVESFEREEQRIAEEVEQQEAEVKRILEQTARQQEAAMGETSQSEWSQSEEEDDEGAASEPLLADRESTGYTTDDPALENISMINETGLTDAEGALSDVNSVFNDPGHDGDMDDNTSMSSRASSRIFDSDAMMSLDSLSALYDSEYDNCYRTDDDVNVTDGVSDLDRIDYFAAVTTDADINLANIRSMSESITRNFGQPRSETDPDSDV